MLKEMCWLSQSPNQTKILHLRTAPSEPWRPYTTFPQYAVPDHQIPNGSKGWATFQRLNQAGWLLVPSTQTSPILPVGLRVR